VRRRETGPGEYDDYHYLVRLLFPIDHHYDDNSDVPSQLSAARDYKAQGNSMQAQTFDGVPYVGAVFSSQNGKPTNHFATAFVVTSKSGDILMSAAHILLNRNAADLLFLAPG
jgi:hypothetical protein